MAKSNVTQYDSTAANNTDVGSISIAEGMAPSNVNNAIRELMAHTANWVSGSQAITKLTTTGEIELGHASDTTIARSSAGVVTIEGATVRTGTVGVADGGTGATTAAAAASAIGVGTEDSPTFTGLTATGGLIVNESASAAGDFRAESQYSSQALFLDASAGTLTGNVSSFTLDSSVPQTIFKQSGTEKGYVRVSSGELQINANDTLQISQGGHNVMRLTGQKVGIGTTDPAMPLHVYSAENILAKFHSSDADALIEFADNSTSDTILLGAIGDNLLFRSDAGTIDFKTNNNATTTLQLLNNTNASFANWLGVGVNPPARALHVKGGTDTRTRTEESGGTLVDITVTNSGHYIDSSGTGALTINKVGSASMHFKTANASAMTITSAQDVGIGTTAPTTFTGFKTFHLKNAAGNAISLIESDGGVIGQSIASDGNGYYVGSRSNHDLRITTNDTPRLTIAAGGDATFTGNVAVNTTLPTIAGTTGSLHLGDAGGIITFDGETSYTNNAYFNSGWKFRTADTASMAQLGSGDVPFRISYSASGSADAAITWTEALQVSAAGNVGIGGTPESWTKLKIINPGGHTYEQIYGPTGYVAETQWYSQNAGGSLIARMDNAGTGVFGTNTNTPLLFITNNEEKVRIKNNGAVGINQSDPQNLLHITDTSSGALTKPIRLHNSATGASTKVGIEFTNSTDATSAPNSAQIFCERTAGSANALVLAPSNGTAPTEALRLATGGAATFAASATFGPGGTGTDRIKVTADGGTGTAGGGLFEIRQNGAYIGGFGNEAALDGSGTSSNLEIRAAANIPIVLAPNNVDCLTLTAGGAAAFAGAVSKGSGSFKIDHPLPAKKDTHYLVHSFVEGPQADLIYRGRAALSDGSATVDIDAAAGMTSGTFEVLCRDVQCFTSNETGWTAVRGSVSGATLTIEAQDADCTDTISWMVVGERQDKHMYDTEWTDDDGKVIVEPEKTEAE